MQPSTAQHGIPIDEYTDPAPKIAPHVRRLLIALRRAMLILCDEIAVVCELGEAKKGRI